MTALLLAAVSLAHAEAPPAAKGNDLDVHVDAAFAFHPEAVVSDGGVRLVAEKDAYLGADVRLGDGFTLARAGAGFDVFGGSGLDLKLGVWMGGLSNTIRPTSYHGVTGGTEVMLGARFDRLYAEHRWIAGFAGPLDGVFTENELTVGFRVLGGASVYGRWTRGPRACGVETDGLGLGVELVL